MNFSFLRIWRLWGTLRMYNYPQRTYADPMPRRPRRIFFVGIFLTLMGIISLVGIGVYALFVLYNKSNLEDMNTSIQGPVALPESSVSKMQVNGALLSDSSFKPIEVIRDVQQVVKDESAVGSVLPVTRQAAAAEPEAPSKEAAETTPPTETVSVVVPDPEVKPVVEEVPASEQPGSLSEVDAGELVSVYNTIYPGHKIHPKYWDRPLTAGTDDYTYGVIRREDGFLEVSSESGLPKGTLSDAVRVRIPSIDLDSEVTNLAILDLGDSKQYETPAHVVGRIPETSNPGEMGNTWLFGHLESPIRGEGNVFRRLPEIPEILKNGDPVYVTVLNEDGEEFMYQITDTTVMHRDELSLYETDDSTITLVTCVPRLIYDHRVVVSGKLVGIRKPA